MHDQHVSSPTCSSLKQGQAQDVQPGHTLRNLVRIDAVPDAVGLGLDVFPPCYPRQVLGLVDLQGHGCRASCHFFSSINVAVLPDSVARSPHTAPGYLGTILFMLSFGTVLAIFHICGDA